MSESTTPTPEPMSPERFAKAERGHIGGARSATDKELMALAAGVAEVAEHEHGADGLADIFCLNQKAWMGGFMAVVLRRLLDAEADRDRLAEQVKHGRELHGRPRIDRHGSGCVQCGIVWPCPTFIALGGTEATS